ncbi:jerky protein homolog-like [Nilaparvata lugens]|uniref:jerky protein homolog-like n=1 Tax=Nilaparvata lugens TaxID=108931 RepID=UPI00193E5948|nr:jerky protein homolog-like [Nilaparvata lugens]
MSDVKRKRLVVTMEQKLKAIERLDKGESVKSISDELGVGVTTVKDWKRNKKSIQDYCTQIESEKILTSRCNLKKPTNEIVDDVLWLWFTQERRKGTPISGPILKENAMALHAKIENCGTFTASDGWLARWKKRHGIHFLSICGEKLSADPGASAGTVFKSFFSRV